MVCALVVGLFPIGGLRASDRIVLQPAEATTPVTLMGDVADFDAESIEVLMTVGEPIRRYPAREVLQVETVHTPAHRRGVELFEAGNIDDADRVFEEALSTEPREWVKREILGWRVRCALRRGDRLGAAQQFLRVIESHADPREWPLVPLVWDAEPISEAIRQQGRIWLVGDTPVARLLGASLLLQHPLYAGAAQGQLQELARVSDTALECLGACSTLAAPGCRRGCQRYRTLEL